MVDELLRCGFDEVIVLDAAECCVAKASSVVLALRAYLPREDSCGLQADIHPYYPESQQAYLSARQFAADHADDGIMLRDDLLVKPIFARLPGFTQGRNTLSYHGPMGSRFHVQIFTSALPLMPTHHLEEKPHELHCGDCTNCVKACPTNALEGGVFHRERCLRNWMLFGAPVPEDLRPLMGKRLIGCDVCQVVCPHNAHLQPEGECEGVQLAEMLENPKAASAMLKEKIGVNLAIQNRVLSQALLLAGASGSKELLPLVESWRSHPSPTVATHAAWAVSRLTSEE